MKFEEIRDTGPQKYDAGAYRRNHRFLTEIRELMQRGMISIQEARVFREQALSGDSDGAQKGLAKLIGERYLR